MGTVRRTVSGRASYDAWKTPGTFENLFYGMTGTGRCFTSRMATGEKNM